MVFIRANTNGRKREVYEGRKYRKINKCKQKKQHALRVPMPSPVGTRCRLLVVVFPADEPTKGTTKQITEKCRAAKKTQQQHKRSQKLNSVTQHNWWQSTRDNRRLGSPPPCDAPVPYCYGINNQALTPRDATHSTPTSCRPYLSRTGLVPASTEEDKNIHIHLYYKYEYRTMPGVNDSLQQSRHRHCRLERR